MKKIGKEWDDDTENIPDNVPENIPKNIIEKSTERQRVIFELARNNPTNSRDQMSQKTGVTIKTILRDLNAMKHIVKRVGGDNGGDWEIIKCIRVEVIDKKE